MARNGKKEQEMARNGKKQCDLSENKRFTTFSSLYHAYLNIIKKRHNKSHKSVLG